MRTGVRLGGVLVIFVMNSALSESRKYYNALTAKQLESMHIQIHEQERKVKAEDGRMYYQRLLTDTHHSVEDTRTSGSDQSHSCSLPQGRKWYESMLRHILSYEAARNKRSERVSQEPRAKSLEAYSMPHGRKWYESMLQHLLKYVQRQNKQKNAIMCAHEKCKKSKVILAKQTEKKVAEKASKTIKKMQVVEEDSCVYGRSYYQSLLDVSYERHALLSCGLQISFTNKAFDAHGELASLAAVGTAGAGVQLQDVFLLARLSRQGKLHIHPPGAVPALTQFGHNPEEQYLNLLAPMTINFDMSQRSYSADITGMYRFESESLPDLSCTLGFQIPIKHKEINTTLMLVGGKLYRTGAVPLVAPRETTITQFFKDFESVEDFFVRVVLRPKKISYAPSQRITGIGDISLFAIADFAECSDCIDGLQCGLSLVLPTAAKSRASTLFEADLGNGGGMLIDIWSNVFFRSGSEYVNPTCRVGVEFGLNKFLSTQRIPEVKVQETEGLLRNNPTLVVPIFAEYRTDPFVEIDSTVPFLADSAIAARMRQGYKMFVGFGNYFYDLFNTQARLGIFYDYLRTGKTKIFGVAARFKTSLLSDSSESRAHRIGWNLSCKTSAGFEILFGSQHILAGKNVAKSHELFASIIALF